jgi:hypothetical protein
MLDKVLLLKIDEPDKIFADKIKQEDKKNSKFLVHLKNFI